MTVHLHVRKKQLHVPSLHNYKLAVLVYPTCKCLIEVSLSVARSVYARGDLFTTLQQKIMHYSVNSLACRPTLVWASLALRLFPMVLFVLF